MENTSYVALSRQTALWRQLETVANNMANANTPAYKGEHMMFRDYLVKTPTPGKAGGEKVAFVQDIGTVRDLNQGQLTATDNVLDVAVEGDGYFVVDTPDGLRYTRNGHFRLDDAGMIVTSQGYPLMQTGDQPIIVAPNESEIRIGKNGAVSSENGAIGTLRIVTFDNQFNLKATGNGLYNTTDAATDMTDAVVRQGYVEESNVQPIVEMTKMIDIMRNYEAAQNLLDGENKSQIKAYEVLSQAKS
jgi:flagellar basal-body rod protein FlgF